MLQALINLIRNATVHSNHSSPIELRVVPGEDEWRYEVADHGGGIPPGQEERIFEPFCRVDQRRPGSGLGLAIVRGVAKAHGAGPVSTTARARARPSGWPCPVDRELFSLK